MNSINNPSDNLWTNKWKPNDITEIIGNKQSISKIDEWLSKFDKHTNNSIIISGSHGIGKTLVGKLLPMFVNVIGKCLQVGQNLSIKIYWFRIHWFSQCFVTV